MNSQKMNDKQKAYAVQLADENIALRIKLSALKSNIKALHKQVNGPYDDYMCEHCYVDEYRYYQYPCPTVQILEEV